MEGISQAVKYLHSLGIIHRDIKLENIMMSQKSEMAQPKLVDFGLSIILGEGQTQCEVYGTEGYMSPEIYFSKQYSKEVDLWSLGILFYAIVSGFMPFEQDDVKKIVKMKGVNFVNFEPEPFHDFNQDGRDLINRILKVDPKERLAIDEILAHPYFTNELKKKKAARPKGVPGVVIEEEEKEG